MRKHFLFLILVQVLTWTVAVAQAPQGFGYQAVVRDAQGRPVAERQVGVRLSLRQGAAEGTEAYAETHLVRTDAAGLFTLAVGGGTPLAGSLDSLDWTRGPYYLKSEVDPDGGTNYTLTTTQQLLSVPYALYAAASGDALAVQQRLDSLARAIPTVPTNVSAFANDAGYLTAERQVLSRSHDTLFLTGGSYVVLPAAPAESDPVFSAWSKDYNDLTNRPALFSGRYDDLAGKPAIPTVPTNVSAFANDAGYLTAERQVLSRSHDTLFLTGGSYVVLPAAPAESDPVFSAWSKDYNDLTNRPALFSGRYDDLAGKPVIPTVPTNVSAFANDAGYLTAERQVLSRSHDTLFLTGGSYVVLPAAPAESDPVFSAWSKDYNDLTNRPALFSGRYDDLAGKPVIPTVPTNVSAFANDAGYLTSYTETQTLAQVVARGNSANGQLKGITDPTDAQDAVNLRTMDSLLAAAVASLTHRFDSVAAVQQAAIDSLERTLRGLSGVLPGAFSVAAGRTVKFSKGNLQYNAAQGTHTVATGGTAQGTWRFAEHQWNTIGAANSNISSTYDGWVDFFGWGTSGWNSGAVAWQPWSTSTTNSDYYPGGVYSNSLTGAYANADWGVYNAISNGGNQPWQWRTLTKDEWDYLFNTRTASTVNGTANARYAKAKVNNVQGMILFPDAYTHPTGVAVPTGVNSTDGTGWNGNDYSGADWTAMEAAGCVFLPAAGYRSGTGVSNAGIGGLYWSSTHYNNRYAYYLDFYSTGLYADLYDNRNDGYSVRLVQD